MSAMDPRFDGSSGSAAGAATDVVDEGVVAADVDDAEAVGDVVELVDEADEVELDDEVEGVAHVGMRAETVAASGLETTTLVVPRGNVTVTVRTPPADTAYECGRDVRPPLVAANVTV